MKTFIIFLAALAASVLAMAAGSGRVDPGSLLTSVGTAALLAAASTDRLPLRRLSRNDRRGPADCDAPSGRPGESVCVFCAAS